MSITLKQLTCLLALGETGHFRRAAEHCGVTQPTLSVQIRNLEIALGGQLVERSPNGAILTPLGRDVVVRAERVVREVQGMVDLAEAGRRGLNGTLKLGASQTLGPYLLPQVVAELHKRHQGLNLYIRESAPSELEYELGQGVHDAVLVQLPVAGADYTVEPLFREPLYLALAVDHQLAERDEISPDDLKGVDVLCLKPEYRLHTQVAGLCEAFGARLVGDYQGTSLDAVRLMAGMGMGVAFLPALYVRSEIPKDGEVVVRRLRGRTVTRSLGLVWRASSGRPDAYTQIADIIRGVARDRLRDLIVEGDDSRAR